jgi:hypothetical protein
VVVSSWRHRALASWWTSSQVLRWQMGWWLPAPVEGGAVADRSSPRWLEQEEIWGTEAGGDLEHWRAVLCVLGRLSGRGES